MAALSELIGQLEKDSVKHGEITVGGHEDRQSGISWYGGYNAAKLAKDISLGEGRIVG